MDELHKSIWWLCKVSWSKRGERESSSSPKQQPSQHLEVTTIYGEFGDGGARTTRSPHSTWNPQNNQISARLSLDENEKAFFLVTKDPTRLPWSDPSRVTRPINSARMLFNWDHHQQQQQRQPQILEQQLQEEKGKGKTIWPVVPGVG